MNRTDPDFNLSLEILLKICKAWRDAEIKHAQDVLCGAMPIQKAISAKEELDAREKLRRNIDAFIP